MNPKPTNKPDQGGRRRRDEPAEVASQKACIHVIGRRNDLSKEVKKRCSGSDRDLWITAQSRFLRKGISQPLVAPASLAKSV
jgi:hypothetical protein